MSPSSLCKVMSTIIYSNSDFHNAGFSRGNEFELGVSSLMKVLDTEFSQGLMKDQVNKDKIKNLTFLGVDLGQVKARNNVGYGFIEDMFFCCENDIETENTVIEIKQTQTKVKSKPMLQLLEWMYLIQCFIQFICFEKEVHLVWLSDEFSIITPISMEYWSQHIPVITKLIKFLYKNHDVDTNNKGTMRYIKKCIQTIIGKEFPLWERKKEK